MQLRRARNRILRELAEAKNLAFRESMVGLTLSVVTLEQNGAALSDNYLPVRIEGWTRANEMRLVRIGLVSETGQREQSGTGLVRLELTSA